MYMYMYIHIPDWAQAVEQQTGDLASVTYMYMYMYIHIRRQWSSRRATWHQA